MKINRRILRKAVSQACHDSFMLLIGVFATQCWWGVGIF